MTVDDKLLDRDNSDTIISKTKKFVSIFFAFLKAILNFQHLPKNDDRHS